MVSRSLIYTKYGFCLPVTDSWPLPDKYIDAQLILTSHDRLAQYWIGMGHISFFERVNIDDFIAV